MSFLTPLYLLGALAVGLPILFHLIRRTPRGRQMFSSVMFLEPSPPRITRRSRIEHWLLLALRALAVCLLAAAFARPFLRQQAAADMNAGAGRWIAVLLDTSASLRRAGSWDESRARLNKVLDDARPDDRLAVYAFDARPRELFGWEAWTTLDPAQRASAVRSALAGLQPSWRDTDLGRALITAAESVEDAATQQREQAPREIVVISDLQSGSRIESLQGFQWPDGVRVRLERIGAASAPTNAGVHLVTDGNDTAAGLRVRVTNVDDATRETFRLRWVDEFAAPSSSPTRGTASATTDASGPTESIVAEAVAPHAPHVDVYVPPGQGRVVRAPPLPDDHPSSRLVLSGDDHAFDNTAFVAHRRARDVTIVYLGSDHADDPAGLRFFLEPLFPSTHERTVHVLDWAFESTTLPESAHGVALVIVTEPPRADQIATLREFAGKGGTVVYVARAAESAAAIYELAGVAPVPAVEATVRGYAMLTDVDFRHPVFVPLSDPRFSDFTKLHFWKHRRIDAAALPDCRVLARFDDGDPAIGEVPLGRGRLVFFASGWGRDDSQLAVWSKFVPLMNALLEYGSGPLGQAAQYLVGEPVPLETLFGARTTITAVRLPDGTEQPIPAGTTVFDAADVPGIYTFTAAAGDGTQSEVRVAVNLAPAESRTSPLTAEALESAGVRFLQSDSPSALQAAAERERQLQNHELENRQKLWRWLIVAAIAVLVLETLVAGRLAARRTESA